MWGKTVSPPAWGLTLLGQSSHVVEAIFVQLCMMGVWLGGGRTMERVPIFISMWAVGGVVETSWLS